MSKMSKAFVQPLDVVEDYLYRPSISFSYQRWVFYREDYESGSSSRSNVIRMGTIIAEDENINNIEGNGAMYMIQKYTQRNRTWRILHLHLLLKR